MIGIDTNVLIRYMERDDEAQARLADALLESLTVQEPGLVTHVVLAELWWVLSSRYKRTKPEIIERLTWLIDVQTVAFQDPDLVRNALSAASAGADFADALIESVNRSLGCEQTVTFDKTAAKRAGMALLR